MSDAATTWLFRIPAVFDGMLADIIRQAGAAQVKRLGREFHLVRMRDAVRPDHASVAGLVRWRLPIDHAWPCHPEKITSFIEKAAQGVCRRFDGRSIQAILCGPLDPHARHRTPRSLASNLRGRMLQLFPKELSRLYDALTQDPQRPTLYALVGNEGLFCGIATPRECGGFHPGGSVFIRQSDATRVSRAGAKLAEALMLLRLDGFDADACRHWLELGASPGGMTHELLARGCRVTAIDRAPIDPTLSTSPGLRFVRGDAARIDRPDGPFDALLCDLNGDARTAMDAVSRMAPSLAPGAPVVFTIKLPQADNLRRVLMLVEEVIAIAAMASLDVVRLTHLNHNRSELTLILRRGGRPAPAITA
jgi:hypothetical protein